MLVRSGTGARVVDVEVKAFDVAADGNCVLRARWTVRGPDGDSVLAKQQDTIVTRAPATDKGVADAAAAGVMSSAIDQLAARIAPALVRLLTPLGAMSGQARRIVSDGFTAAIFREMFEQLGEIVGMFFLDRLDILEHTACR